MQVRRLATRLRDEVQRYGPWATLHDVQCRVLNRAVHFEDLKGMVIELDQVGDVDLFDAGGYDARFVDGAELSRYARDGGHDLTFNFLLEASSRGDRCYAIFDGETLASYGWYAQQSTAIDEHFVLHFDPAYTYMYKGFTRPEYRGKRLHAVGMCRALRAFTEEGRKGLVSYVRSNNFASLRSVARMGYRIFGDIFLVRVHGHAFAYATRGCAPYGFRAAVVEPTPYEIPGLIPTGWSPLSSTLTWRRAG